MSVFNENDGYGIKQSIHFLNSIILSNYSNLCCWSFKLAYNN